MTIGGGGPIDRPGGVGDASPINAVDEVREAEPIGGVDEVQATAAAVDVQGVSAATDMPHVAAIDRIAAQFASGQIDRASAVDAIIETVMPADAQGIERTELKAMMVEIAEHDAYLQQLIGRLDRG